MDGLNDVECLTQEEKLRLVVDAQDASNATVSGDAPPEIDTLGNHERRDVNDGDSDRRIASVGNTSEGPVPLSEPISTGARSSKSVKGAAQDRATTSKSKRRFRISRLYENCIVGLSVLSIAVPCSVVAYSFAHHPGLPALIHYCGSLPYASGDAWETRRKSAVKDLSEILKKEYDPDVQVDLASAQMLTDDYAAAERNLNEAIARGTAQKRAANTLAELRFAHSLPDKATIQLLKNVLSAVSDKYLYTDQALETLLLCDQYEEVVSLIPSSGDLYVMGHKGLALSRLGRAEEAANVFALSKEQLTDFWYHSWQHTLYCLDKGLLAEAKEDVASRGASVHDMGSASTVVDGWVSFADGDYSKALTIADTVLSNCKDPILSNVCAKASANKLRYEALKHLGRTNDAAAAYRSYMKMPIRYQVLIPQQFQESALPKKL
jgi:tetratricopeptide (TPR) repeat protein